MNLPRLIELVEQQLPQDLTAEQLAAIREAMRSSPALRRAIVEQLGLEQALSTRLAPAAPGQEQLLEHLEKALRARRRARWRRLGGFMLIATLGTAIGLWAMYGGGGSGAGDSTRRSASGDSGTGRAAVTAGRGEGGESTTTGATDTVVTGGNDTKHHAATADAGPTQRADPITQVGGSGRTEPDDASWRWFDDAAARGDAEWQVEAERVVRPIEGVMDRGAGGGASWYALDGWYELPLPGEGGRAVRLRLHEVSELRLVAWSGGEGVEARLMPDRSLRAMRAWRSRGGDAAGELEPERVQAVMDDGWTWRLTRFGAIEVRYEAGRLVVSHGPRGLVSAPMAGAPTRLVMRAKARLSLAESLALPLAAIGQAAAESTAADVAWRVAQPVGAAFETNDKGRMRLTRREGRAEHRATFDVSSAPGEVTMVIDHPTTHTGVIVENPSTGQWMAMHVGRWGEDLVLCDDPNSEADVKRCASEGLTFRDRFEARVTMGLDHVSMWFSGDGWHWVRVRDVRLEPDRALRARMQVGVMTMAGDGERHVAVEQVRIGQDESLTELADDRLRRAAAERLSDWEGGSGLWLERIEAALSDAAAAVADGASDGAWRRAVLAAAMDWPAPPSARNEAAIELLRQAIEDDVEMAKIVPALHALPRQMVMAWDNRDAQAWGELTALYDQLATRRLLQGDGEAVSTAAEAWYRQSFGSGPREYWRRQPVPTGLMRLRWHDLYERGQWAALRREAMQYQYMLRRGDGGFDEDEAGLDMPAIARWMAAQAQERLENRAASAEHPLVVDADRAASNMLAEAEASIETTAYDHAARVLTRSPLPRGLVRARGEADLFQSTQVAVQTAMRRSAPLAAAVRDGYGQAGLLRLRLALNEDDARTIADVAAQFHGTEPGWEAMRLLADRDLSMGRFISAAERYRRLSRDGPAQTRGPAAAKHRLAMAMAGRASGEPISDEVRFDGQAMSGQAFEELVASLIERHRQASSDSETAAANVAPAAPSGDGAFETVSLGMLEDAADLPPGRRDARQTALTLAGDRLVVHRHGVVSVIDLTRRQVVWRRASSAKGLGGEWNRPARALLHRGLVIVPTWDDGAMGLSAWDANTGEVRWTRRFDDGVLGEPIEVGGWIYVLSVRKVLGDYGQVMLNRVSAEAGDGSESWPVIRARYGAALHRVGRPAIAGDRLVIRLANAVVCCDLFGEVRWVRRMAYVPAEADRSMFEQREADDLLVMDERVIVGAPGSPHVQCVEIETGEAVWSLTRPLMREVAGVTDGAVILRMERGLEQVEASSGQTRWHRAMQKPVAGAMIAANGSVMVIGSAGSSMGAGGRYGLEGDRLRGVLPGVERRGPLQWVSGASGRWVGAASPSEGGLERARRVVSDGRVMVYVAERVAGDRVEAELFVLEPR